MMMNLIGFVIENSSYNWSIITHRNSNTNSVEVFHCIKLINGKSYGIFHNCANTLIIPHGSLTHFIPSLLEMDIGNPIFVVRGSENYLYNVKESNIPEGEGWTLYLLHHETTTTKVASGVFVLGI